MSVLGNEVRRVEDPRMLSEGGTYVGDIAFEDMAHVVFVRSTMAHADIAGVDVTEAVAMPGVLGVFTAADVTMDLSPVMPMLSPAEFARPLLATGRVRFVGEPVAAVVAESPYQAADAAEMVFVDYEPRDAVVDPEIALDSDNLLFEKTESNVCLRLPSAESIDFSACEAVIEARVVNSRIYASPIEPRVASAYWADDGRLVCHSSTQGAHPARQAIAGPLGMDEEEIRLVIPDVGGSFGAKARPNVEEILLGPLAERVGRPVMWIETRTENAMALGHGRGQIQYLTLGGQRDGTLSHYKVDIVQDSGAYAEIGSLLPMFTRMMATGVYTIPNVEFSSRSVVTTTAPLVAFRGAGRPEATAAIERAVDIFAAEIGMDPAEVRRRNLIPADAFPYTTPTETTYDCGDYEGALDKALAAAGYDDLRADQAQRRESGATKLLGIGVSTYVEVTSPIGAPAITEFGSVELRADGTVLARTGSTPYGQGHVTTWKMIVADRLGVPMDAIEIVHGDTDEIPSSGISGGSRSAQIAGSAMHDASNKLIEQASATAADLLEAAVDDIVLDRDSGVFHVAGTPARSVDWGAVGTATTSPLVGLSDFAQASPTFPFGAHIAVVEVDAETGAVKIVRFIAVDDAGTLLNPLLAHGQIHGGISSGAAQALLEEVRYDEDGNLLTSNFADYAVISAAELPSFELVTQETPTPHNPLGAKGIGESGTIGATPAVQNAVVDALAHLGIRHLDMPAAAERVWTAIQNA